MFIFQVWPRAGGTLFHLGGRKGNSTGGPSAKTQATERQLTQADIGVMQQQNQLQQENYQRMLNLQQPEIGFLQGVTKGGPETVSAAMPFISQISQGYESSQQQIRNTVPPGAARDFALSQLEEQKDTSTSTFINQQVLAAFDKLANIGAGLGSFSLQELGASLSAGQAGSEANIQTGKMEAAASPWNVISNLVGDVAGMFSFSPFGKAAPASGGGGGGAYV